MKSITIGQTTVKDESHAFSLGYACYKQCLGHNNPYPLDDPKALAWQDGWDAARSDTSMALEEYVNNGLQCD